MRKNKKAVIRTVFISLFVFFNSKLIADANINGSDSDISSCDLPFLSLSTHTCSDSESYESSETIYEDCINFLIDEENTNRLPLFLPLPDELTIEILEYLKSIELSKVSASCQGGHRLVRDPQLQKKKNKEKSVLCEDKVVRTLEELSDSNLKNLSIRELWPGFDILLALESNRNVFKELIRRKLNPNIIYRETLKAKLPIVTNKVIEFIFEDSELPINDKELFIPAALCSLYLLDLFIFKLINECLDKIAENMLCKSKYCFYMHKHLSKPRDEKIGNVFVFKRPHSNIIDFHLMYSIYYKDRSYRDDNGDRTYCLFFPLPENVINEALSYLKPFVREEYEYIFGLMMKEKSSFMISSENNLLVASKLAPFVATKIFDYITSTEANFLSVYSTKIFRRMLSNFNYFKNNVRNHIHVEDLHRLLRNIGQISTKLDSSNFYEKLILDFKHNLETKLTDIENEPARHHEGYESSEKLIAADLILSQLSDTTNINEEPQNIQPTVNMSVNSLRSRWHNRPGQKGQDDGGEGGSAYPNPRLSNPQTNKFFDSSH